MSIKNKIIDYQDNEKDITHWVNLKGEYRYEEIIKFLNEKKIICDWKNVTYYIKYDKRLLINSFKYIVFLEEFYKSCIIRKGKKKLSDVKKYKFSSALEEYLLICDKYNFDNMNLELLREEVQTIIEFRNRIVHNKILLNQKYNKKSLEEVLKIFVEILPNSYRQGFIKDINSCSKEITEKLWCIKLDNNEKD